MGRRSGPSGGSTDERSALAPDLWIGAALAATVVALYARVVGFDFVGLDDDAYVVANPQVRAGLTWAGIRWALAATEAANWHPLTWLSHMLDVSWFGLRPGGHHATSVALHAASAALLFAALRAMTGQRWPSAFVAAAFAVHPMRVESVAWIAERKDVLSGFFWMLTLVAYARYARRPGRGRYACVAASLALGLAAKPMLVTLPLVLLLLDLWPLRRPPKLGLLLEKVPLLALCAASSAITVVAQSRGEAVVPLRGISLGQRVAGALVSYVAYLKDTVWPAGLACFYPHPATIGGASGGYSAVAALGAGAVLAAATAVVLVERRRRPYLATGWFWYLGTLVPVIGIVQVGVQARADRYAYLPLVGIYLLVAWGAAEALGSRPAGRRALATAAALSLLALSALTWRQIGTWRDGEALFRRAVSATKDNYFAHAGLGAIYAKRGRGEEAERHLREALRLAPDYSEARNGLGLLYGRRGRFAEAEGELRRVATDHPRWFEARSNLAAVLLAQGKLADAEGEYRAALALRPDSAAAHYNLGATLERRLDWPGARAEYERAVALDPASADAHYNLGIVLERTGELARAEGAFERAATLRPAADAWTSLGIVRLALGKLLPAADALERAVRMSPDDPEARYRLGIALARLGKTAEALGELERAARLDPRDERPRLALEALRSGGMPPAVP